MVFAALALLSLAAAAPFVPSARSPTLSTSKGFILTAHVTDASRDLSPSVEGMIVDPVHYGAGLNIATLSAPIDFLELEPYYVNGTDADVAAGITSVLNDIGTDYPWGWRLPPTDARNPSYPGEYWADVDIGGGTAGISIATADGADHPTLTGPAAGSRYAACFRFIGDIRANATIVDLVYEGVDVPADCAPIELLPVCADFTGNGNGGAAREVPCLESLSGL